MNIATQQLAVRHFYEEKGVHLFEAIYQERAERFAPDFEKIIVVSLGNLNPFEVWIRRRSQKIPHVISETFSRHLWYSQWNLANLALIKVSINAEEFFFLFHTGISDDAYDNDALFVEIFNEQGHFISAPNYIYGNEVTIKKWSTSQTSHEDCRTGQTGEMTPPWPKDDPHAVYRGHPLWTEDVTIQAVIDTESSVEVQENEDGTTTTISYLRELIQEPVNTYHPDPREFLE